MPADAKQLIQSCVEVIGASRPAEDWKIQPSAHASALQAQAPELASVLNESRVQTTASQYERADAEAIAARDAFKSASRMSSRCVFVLVILGALLLAVGTLFPDAPGAQPDSEKKPGTTAAVSSTVAPVYITLGVLSIIMGGLATVYISKVRNGGLLEDWFRTRAEAERRRLEYFDQIASVAGSETDSRLNLLKLEYVRRYLLLSQIAFYEKREREHAIAAKRNASLSAWGAGAATVATGLSGFLAIVDPRLAALSAIGVMCTGFVSLRTQFEEIEQNRRNAERYRRTLMLLEDLAKVQIDSIRAALASGEAERASTLTVFCQTISQVLMEEHAQWLDSAVARKQMIANLQQEISRLRQKAAD